MVATGELLAFKHHWSEEEYTEAMGLERVSTGALEARGAALWCATFSQQYAGLRLLLLSDNQSSVIALERCYSPIATMRQEGRRARMLCARHHVTLHMRFVLSVLNPVADLLSHDHVQEAQCHATRLFGTRFEVIPMVTIEAQLCGRIVIATKCGRNGELVDDNETGFLSAAPTAVLVDEVMERAWAHREEWQSMGYLAAQRLRERYSRDPTAHFASLLESLAESPPPLA